MMVVVLCRSFIILEKRSRNCTSCTTHELVALNMRLQDAATDCLMLTEQVRRTLHNTMDI